ncbi:MAG TPA: glycosyltransferase family 4 protein [Solirubrobacterales bacterium]|nr:glycosyltransferase family 4 protein [Solirubrobacterales bacterium]
MRVLYVNQTAQVSGAERSLLALLEGLDGRVERVVACPEGELAAAVRELGIEHEPILGTQASFRLHPVHTSRGLAEIGRSALQVRRLVARLRPDLVHANTTRAALLALLARNRSGPPVLAHIRDWVPEGRFSRFVLALVARRAAGVVANSAYIAGQFDGLSTQGPVRVIHNPVDLQRFNPRSADGGSIRRELGLDGDATVLAVVAQLTPWKGQDDAIEVVADLAGRGREVTLLLAGSAKFASTGTSFDNVEYERRLRALAEELGVGERVRFLGERSDVPEILAAADLLLMPSWREAFGRIAVEAMAMGTPVVATNVGGPPEIFASGVEGLLLAPRQSDLWASEIEQLLGDPRRLADMRERALGRAAEFELSAHATVMLGCYQDLLARR